MVEKLALGLPVMLQYEKEIGAFLAAKERIEKLGDKRGFPLDVNVFLFFNSSALSQENRENQIRNQVKYNLLKKSPLPHWRSFA